MTYPVAAGEEFLSEDHTWISNSPEETFSFGQILGEKLQQGDIVALCGELGAGKTCLTQGIARGLGVPEEYPITSPTFTIINEYPGRFILYHLDLYRVSSADEFDGLGGDICFGEQGVAVVEWAEKVKDLLPEGTLFILITYLDENKRKFIVSRDRERISELISEVRGGW